jgi:hypothetical protein
MPYKDTETGTAKEKRAARDKARNQARKQLEQPSRKSRRQKPGKTPFASYIKVKNWRHANGLNEYFIDLTIGPVHFKHAWYAAETGQLQLSTCRTETRRGKINGPYYVQVVRPLIIKSLEAHASKMHGQPVRLDEEMQFTPPPKKSSARRKNAA